LENDETTKTDNMEQETYTEDDVKEILIRIIETFDFDVELVIDNKSIYALECMIGERIGWLQ